jgi:hypothetical protein
MFLGASLTLIAPWSNSPAVDPVQKFSLGNVARGRNTPMNAAF